MRNAYGFETDYGTFTGHPLDPRTAETPDFALSVAADKAMSMAGHWFSFFEDFAKDDRSEVKSWLIKPEHVTDQDASTLIVLALTGTAEQAAAARLYLQEAFYEHHSELIEQIAAEGDDE